MEGQEIETLNAACGNFIEAKTARTNRVEARWVTISTMIDRECRVWVVITYTLLLSLLFSVEFDDEEYARRLDPPNQTSGMLPMHVGMFPARLQGHGLQSFLVILGLCLAFLFCTYGGNMPCIDRVINSASKVEQKIMEAEKAAEKTLWGLSVCQLKHAWALLCCRTCTKATCMPGQATSAMRSSASNPGSPA